MAVTEAQKRATAKYIKANYDLMSLRLPKGKKKEFTDRAKELGYDSFSEFTRKAIIEKLERGEK